MYDYAWEGLGLVVTGPEGSCFLQGEDAARNYDELEGIERPEVLQAALGEYAPVIRRD